MHTLILNTMSPDGSIYMFRKGLNLVKVHFSRKNLALATVLVQFLMLIGVPGPGNMLSATLSAI